MRFFEAMTGRPVPVLTRLCVALLVIAAVAGCSGEERNSYTGVVAEALGRYLQGRDGTAAVALENRPVEIVGCPFVLYYDDTSHHAVEMDWGCDLLARESPAAAEWRYARNIWVLKRVGDRLYMGSGNSSNRGPSVNAGTRFGGIPVVYYDLGHDRFRTEALIDEEQIDRYVMLNKKLCIPGHDATEDWSFGNYHCRKWDGAWRKFRNIPDGVHVYDLAMHNRYVHAAIARRYCPETGHRGEVLFFDEDRDAWQSLHRFGSRVYTFIEIRGKLFAVREMPRDNSAPQTEPFVVELTLGREGVPRVVGHDYLSAPTLFPDTTLSERLLKKIARSVSAGRYGVYIGATVFNDHQARPFGVYLAALDNAGQVRAQKIRIAEEDYPWDLLVRNDKVYLLTNTKNYTRQSPRLNIARVYSIRQAELENVDAWEPVLQFETRGLARSFEKAGGYFYFGIGSEVGNSIPGTFDLHEVITDTGTLVRVKMPL